jgi:acetyl/propionyl-CoA carboxylase alpha subunit
MRLFYAPSTMLFDRVLIANRGEIAARIARTCRRLGIATVGIHSEADAGALHTTVVDESHCVGPAAARESYLNVEAILEVARKTGARAVHPGYGLLSEKVHFARAVQEAGLTWIGPPPAVLERLGDKMRSRATALAANVAPVPGANAPLETLDEARAVLDAIGFPALVKPVGGGGGIGMQILRDATGLERAMKACADRGASAFNDPRVYIERFVERPRHIEVQIFGDAHGEVVALGERECSLQRRHQKIVEESPAPAFDGPEGEARRAAILDAALRIGRAVGYVGAGTVEFIWDSARAEFYFLEVNCRIQVEHPVTEMRFGLDLVEHQLRVAAGERLAEEVRHATPRGHAIEARVYAEDPAKGFLPRPGDIDTLVWPEGEHIRVDAGVAAPTKVTPFYDPMIAKVLAWAPDRATAIARLGDALAATQVAPLVNNLVFLQAALKSEEFASGQYDTTFAEAFAKRK